MSMVAVRHAGTIVGIFPSNAQDIIVKMVYLESHAYRKLV